MKQPAYCNEQCSICPLRDLEAQSPDDRDYVARNIANVFGTFNARKILEADRQEKFVHDGSSIRELRWQAQILSDQDSRQLDLDDERRVDDAILAVANGNCEYYIPERR